MTVLRIRRLEKRDLHVRVAWFNSEDAYHYMPLDVPFSLAETEAWFSTTLLNPARRDFVAVIDNDNTEKIAAMFGLVNIDIKNRKAEFYIIVNSTVRRQGIGDACAKWLCNYGFGYMGLSKIYLFTLFDNEKARKFYERLHFKLEGVLRKHLFYNGVMTDRCIYGMLAGEWCELPWSDLDSLALDIELEGTLYQ